MSGLGTADRDGPRPDLGAGRASRLRGLAPGAVRLGLVLMLGGVSSGLLALGLGTALSREPAAVARYFWVTECSGLPAPGPGTRLSVVRLAAPATGGAALDLHFLAADGAVLRTQQTKLIAGAQMSFSLPAQEMVAALRVVADEEVDVQITQQIYGAEGGRPEVHPVPCRCRV